MSTLKQKIAARANGAKSRGPVTEAGKEISSRNAVRHGMLSATFLFDDEKHVFFDELVANLYDEHNPTTETERVLIETMAISRWRQMRLWNLEKTMLTEEMMKNRRAAGPHAPGVTLPNTAPRPSALLPTTVAASNSSCATKPKASAPSSAASKV